MPVCLSCFTKVYFGGQHVGNTAAAGVLNSYADGVNIHADGDVDVRRQRRRRMFEVDVEVDVNVSDTE